MLSSGGGLRSSLDGRNGRRHGARFWYPVPASCGHTTANTLFHDLQNVPMISHVSGWIEEMLGAGVTFVAEHFRRVSEGATPLNPVGP